MRKKPIILLILIISLPLMVLLWLGSRIALQEQTVVQQQFRDILTTQLKDVDQIVSIHFDSIEGPLRRIASFKSLDADSIRERVRSEPLVRQIIVLNANGTVLHPPTDNLNDSERQFLVEITELIDGRDLMNDMNANTLDQAMGNGMPQLSEPNQWYVWYWGRGINLIFRQRRPSGEVVGVLVERARWMADLVSTLPATVDSDNEESAGLPTRIRLLDSVGRPVYQWGAYEASDVEIPFAEYPVSSPLTAWRLQAFLPPEMLDGASRSARLNLVISLSVAAVTLGLLVFVFWRDVTREMQEAAQRVSFVNQVSHELRTPLTNIRMYADLLGRDLEALPEEESSSPRDRLRIIVSESSRLSRLIGNVLTFARQQRRTLALRPKPASVDSVINDVLEQFEPALQRNGIESEFDAAAPGTVLLDVDVLEQILVNLFSNVEKYAASGGRLCVVSRFEKNTSTVTVSDNGPGIPDDKQEAVFQPFQRLSNKLEDVAGTGIGLSIARELARLHGGDVTLVRSEVGAVFRVVLNTPAEEKSP